MTMPNKTYELRRLYFEQHPYGIADSPGDAYPSLLQWPANGYFTSMKPDAELLQDALTPLITATASLSEQVFGNQMKHEYFGLKHLSNLFYERCRLHKQHIKDIDRSHIQIQEIKYGVEINHFPDRAKRLSTLEGQLLQLEQQRREEELAFWKDTADLREKMFENAGLYSDIKHRYSIFSGMEANYGRQG
jgi:CII-binding regulator of phage lambda lysogenization HflD